MKEVILLFESARAAIKSERICKENSIFCRVIPVPHNISSECGMALEVAEADCKNIELLLKEISISVRFIRPQ